MLKVAWLKKNRRRQRSIEDVADPRAADYDANDGRTRCVLVAKGSLSVSRRERMHKHTSQLRGPGGHNAGYHGANRGPVRRWNSFHGGGGGGNGGTGNFNDGVGNGGTKACQEPFRAVPKAVQALRSESVDRAHRAQPPPPPAFPRRRFSVW